MWCLPPQLSPIRPMVTNLLFDPFLQGYGWPLNMACQLFFHIYVFWGGQGYMDIFIYNSFIVVLMIVNVKSTKEIVSLDSFGSVGFDL